MGAEVGRFELFVFLFLALFCQAFCFCFAFVFWDSNFLILAREAESYFSFFYRHSYLMSECFLSRSYMQIQHF